MLRKASDRVNEALARFAPEKRITLRSQTRSRYLRLSPFGQVAAVALCVGVVSWAGYATTSLLRLSAVHMDADAAVSATAAAYEARIAALTERNMRLGESLSRANQRADAAVAALSSRHAALSEAVASEHELASTLQSHRDQLAGFTIGGERVAEACAATASRLTALEVDRLALDRENRSLTTTVANLNDALTLAASARDDATEMAIEADAIVASLSAELEERIARQNRLFSQLEDAAQLSLASFEDVFSKTDVDVDPILNSVKRDYTGKGGPFVPADGAALSGDEAEDARIVALFADLERVNLMRVAVDRMPFARPVGAARFTSGFGYRRDPKNGRRSLHAGIDLAGPRGTAIYAGAPGEVVKAGRMRGYGNVIKIRHAFGYETVYAHLHRIRVEVGDVVERGDRIGDMGNTGRSTGTHLHYEIRRNGAPVNPAKYIEAARNVL